jgi:hypothetical protein
MTRQFYLPSIATAVAFGLLLAGKSVWPLLAARVLLASVALVANEIPYVRAARRTESMREAVAQAVELHGGDLVALIDVPFDLEGVPFFVAPFGTPRAFAPPFAERETRVHPLSSEALVLLRETQPGIWAQVAHNLPVVRFHRDESRFTVHRVRERDESTHDRGTVFVPVPDSIPLPGMEPAARRRIRATVPGAVAKGTVRWWAENDPSPRGEARLEEDPTRPAGTALLRERIDWLLAGPLDRIEIDLEKPASSLHVSFDEEPDSIEVRIPAEDEEVDPARPPLFEFRSPWRGAHRIALVPNDEGVLARIDARLVTEDPAGQMYRATVGSERIWAVFAASMRGERPGFRVEVVDPADPSVIVAASPLCRLAPPGRGSGGK